MCDVHGADPVYPPSLYRAVSYASTLGVPVYILENGMPCAQDDDRRKDWIDGCLAEARTPSSAVQTPELGRFFWNLHQCVEGSHSIQFVHNSVLELSDILLGHIWRRQDTSEYVQHVVSASCLASLPALEAQRDAQASCNEEGEQARMEGVLWPPRHMLRAVSADGLCAWIGRWRS